MRARLLGAPNGGSRRAGQRSHVAHERSDAVVLGLVALAACSLACGAGAQTGPGASGNTGGTGGARASGSGGSGGTPSGSGGSATGSGGSSGGTGNTTAAGKPGVQVANGVGIIGCVPLCVVMTDPALDPQGDDYGYEAGGSCVIPHTATATNDSCTTGAPIPAPVPHPGLVTRSAAGALECKPKCTFYTSPTQKGANSDGFADDWAYENNSTCVIPNTVTAATSLTCTTGMPIPPSASRPGVTVLNPTSKALECVATCTYFASTTQVGANGDNLGDDWAYEFGGSCIIPGTITSFNDPCTTGQAIPAPQPRPGITVNADPVVDSCKASACVPLCRHVTVAPSPAYPDWGWENNNSCVIPNTPTATTVPKGLPDLTATTPLPPPGPTRKCTWGAAPTDFLKPPALNPTLLGTRPAHFQTAGKVLQDPYGQPFLIRGVNNSDGWYDICGQYSAYQGLDAIAKVGGVNAVRLGWAFQSIDPVGPLMPPPLKSVIGTNAGLLAEILYHIVELKMIPILALNDSTGQITTDWPLKMAQFLTAPDYKAVLKAYEPYLLVGIANEWNGVDATYAGAYNAAVQWLRMNQVNNTLVVTGNAWGQGCDSVLLNAPGLTAMDPLHNILYDLHLYTYITLNGVSDGTAQTVQGCLDRASTLNIPTLVGEFGNTHGTPPVAVFYQTIVDRAKANGQGFAPWLWYGDTEYPALNLATSWSGPLSAWGTLIVPQLAGVKATIFP